MLEVQLRLDLFFFSKNWGRVDGRKKAFSRVMEKINCVLMLCWWFFPFMSLRASVGWVFTSVYGCLNVHIAASREYFPSIPSTRGRFYSHPSQINSYSSAELFTKKCFMNLHTHENLPRRAYTISLRCRAGEWVQKREWEGASHNAFGGINGIDIFAFYVLPVVTVLLVYTISTSRLGTIFKGRPRRGGFYIRCIQVI